MKKALSLILILGVFLSITVAVFSSSAANSKIYYAFGDSIAAGYGLSNRSNAYPQLLANKLNMNVTNLARDGQTSTGLLNTVTSLTAAVKNELSNASLITISIGGNDLIGADNFYNVVLPELQNYFSSGYQMSAEMKAIYAKFESNLQAIFTTLHLISPNARIFIQTLYNPYLVGLGALTVGRQLDYFIDNLNSSMYSVAKKFSYVILIDVAQDMNGNSSYFYGGSSLFDLDFHPTLSGHVKIAEILYESCSQLFSTTKATTESQASEQTTRQTTTSTSATALTTLETVLASTTETSIQSTSVTSEQTTLSTEKETTIHSETITETTFETTTIEHPVTHPISTTRSIYDPFATKETKDTETFIPIKTETTKAVNTTIRPDDTTIQTSPAATSLLQSTSSATKTETTNETSSVQTANITSSLIISSSESIIEISTRTETQKETIAETTTDKTDNSNAKGIVIGVASIVGVVSVIMLVAIFVRKQKAIG